MKQNSARVVYPTRRDFVKYHGKDSVDSQREEFLEVPLMESVPPAANEPRTASSACRKVLGNLPWGPCPIGVGNGMMSFFYKWFPEKQKIPLPSRINLQRAKAISRYHLFHFPTVRVRESLTGHVHVPSAVTGGPVAPTPGGLPHKVFKARLSEGIHSAAWLSRTSRQLS